MTENIALFDMDGTLADYEAGLRKDLAKIAAPNDPHYPDLHNTPDWIEQRIRLIRTQPGWWQKLQPIPLGFTILKTALETGFHTRILTKGPRKSTNAWTEKVLWCQHHIEPIDPRMQITITEDKGLVYGKVLVDDYPPYMDRWLQWRPRGLGIMPAQKWNEDYKHPNVLRYDGNNHWELKQRLHDAYHRQPREE